MAAPGPAFDLVGAIAAADDGATIEVPPGVYEAPITIAKPLRLVGRDWPVLQGPGEGTVLTVSASDVSLEGFVVRGSGLSHDHDDSGIVAGAPRARIIGNRIEDALFGIYLKQAPDSIVRDNAVSGKARLDQARQGDGIRLWYSRGSVVEGNAVDGVRDVVIWFSPDTIIRGNRITSGRYGVHTMFSDHQLVEENVLEGNSVGAYLMYGVSVTLRNNLIRDSHGPSGFGVGLKDVDNVEVRGNRIVANRVGAYVDNSPREPSAHLRFENNVIAYNETGLQMLPSVRRNTYRDNAFIDNGEQVAISGSGELRGNHWSEDGRGNFWSDYSGFDADRDGVGDMPFVSRSFYEDLMATYPELRLFRMGLAAEALDLAAEAFPVFRPRDKISDERPLTRAPSVPDVPGLPRGNALTTLVASAALLVGAVTIVIASGAVGTNGWTGGIGAARR